MGKDFLYNQIAGTIAINIKSGELKTGERLPSVRNLSKEYGVSINTAKRVYFELEAQSLVQSKPQSGYFVSPMEYLKLPLPEASQPLAVANSVDPDQLINGVYSAMGRTDLTFFSLGVPSGDLLPLTKLKKEIVLATRSLKGGGTEYEPLQGNRSEEHTSELQSRENIV